MHDYLLGNQILSYSSDHRSEESLLGKTPGNGGVDTEELAAAMLSLHVGHQEKLWDSMRKTRLLKWVMV